MRILIPVDGSAASKAAVKFVATRSALLGETPEVELLNVQTPVPPSVVRSARDLVREFHKNDADSTLGPAQAALEKAGLKVTARYVVGHPGSEVGRVAAKDRADLIVMGSHGRTALKGLLFGSVTQSVLATSKTPLLVLRGDTQPRGESLKVGIAVDGSPFSLAAVKYFLKHRALFGPKPQLTLIHAIPDLLPMAYQGFAEVPLPSIDSDEIEKMRATAYEKAVKPARKLLAKAGVDVSEQRIDGNDLAYRIAQFATKKKLDLLLMGSHGHGALKSALLGSVAMGVAARCGTPLLLIRHK